MSGPTNDAAGPREPAGLVYHSDDRPGITRRRRGRGFSYHAPDGALIRDPAERRRIEAIAVPPAYRSVWITPEPRGHLQATGRDSRGRKQYLYHPDWQAVRARRKYDGLAAFGRALPALRARIDAGLRAEAGSRELALAAVLALLDRAAIRIGTPDYARDNNSYGATTLLEQHVRFDGDSVTLDFPGKGGATVTRQLRGTRLQRALHKIHDLPGAELISWQANDGTVHAIHSDQVNALLETICGPGATAKTFRTWNGTHAAFSVADAPGEIGIGDMAEAAARRLGNTATVARNSYIHPDVIGLAELPGDERTARLDALQPAELSRLRRHEGRLIAFLESNEAGQD